MVNYIGIDLGLKSYLVDSNNVKVENPKYLDKSLLKLKKEQRKLSKMTKDGNNYNKQSIKLSKIHHKIRNQRDDFLQ